VIFAAAAVMVAVFFTFVLSGPLPPKETGVVVLALPACSTPPPATRPAAHPAPPHGRAAWWTPAWMRRVLPDIRFSHD
jgi:RND superfamily putative drug exporter